MNQDAKGQSPGIDLTFADGRTGRIWGLSGLDDLRGASFQKAASYLESRAEQDDVFDWQIEVDLELVMSFSFQPLLNLLLLLDKLVQDDPDGGRAVTIVWKISPGDVSMGSMARQLKEIVEAKQGNGRGLVIEIVDKPPLRAARR
jgi:hypothetical protein